MAPAAPGTKEAGVYHAPPSVKSVAGKGERGGQREGCAPIAARLLLPSRWFFDLPLFSSPHPSSLSSLPTFSGSIGGVVEAACLQPIDVIKTRLQLDHGGQYKGIVDCGRTIARTEGVAALWKGLTPFATHLTIKYALRMGTNAFYQGLLRDADGGLTAGRRMLAGSAAGVTEALVVVTPFEKVKVALQAQHGTDKARLKYKGPIHAATLIVKEQGVRALWTGAAPTVLRNGTNQMCLFSAKPAFDRVYWGKHEGDARQLAPLQSMASGFSAACIGPIATGPFDVCKTRLQAQGAGATEYKGFLDVLIKVPREEGVRALWKGLTPRLLRIPPGQAIVWAVSDQVTGWFERRERQRVLGGR